MPNPRSIPNHLLILHYHLRPGGVRRVIEMYLPALAASGAFDTITLAVGEAADRAWEEPLKASLAGVNFRIHVEPALGYLTERAADAPRMRQALRGFLAREIGGRFVEDEEADATHGGLAVFFFISGKKQPHRQRQPGAGRGL